MPFLITTTGSLNPVVFNDLAGRTIPHPTVDFDLETVNYPDEIAHSADVQAAIDAGHITVTDGFGNAIVDARQAISPTPPTRIRVTVRNQTGSALLAGTLVSPIGQFAPGISLVDIADKRLPAVRPAIGVLESDLPDGTTGTALVLGYLSGIIDTSAFAVNDQLALGDNGTFVRPPPDTDPFEGEIQLVAVVTKVGVLDGELHVSITSNLGIATGAHGFFLREVSMTGHISGGDVTRAGGLDLDVAGGIGFVNQGFDLTRVKWLADTVTVPPNSLFTVVVDVGGAVQVVLNEDPTTHIILARGYSNATDIIALSDHQINLTQAGAQVHNYARDVIGPVLASGLATLIHSPPSLQLAVDVGEFYIDNHRLTAAANAPIDFRYWYRDGSGGWTTVNSLNQVDPDQYDDGSGTLAALAAGQYKRDLLFVGHSDDGTEYHIVYGQTTFTSQSEAEGGIDPAPPPQLLSLSLRIAGIVLLQGATAITSIVDRRPFLGQQATGSTVVNDHGNLAGLADDDHPQYVHNSSARTITAQHTFNPPVANPPIILGPNAQGQLVTGLNADQLDGQHATDFADATHATQHQNGGIDEIDVSGLSGLLADPQTPTLHAASHQHGGGDEVATATPAANAIPKAGAGSTLAEGWVAQATESVRGSAELATQAETDAGTDDQRIVTPLKLRNTSLAGRDTNAVHTNVAAEIAGVTLKAAPAAADLLLIEDSTAANAKRRVTVASLRGVAEVFYPAETSSNSTGTNYRVRSVGGTGNRNFTFLVPLDFGSLVSLELIGFASSGGSPGIDKNIDLTSNYGAVGELVSAHTQTDTTTLYVIPAQNTLFALDLAPVFTSLAAGDAAGVNVNHVSIGGSIDYLGIRMRYNRS